MVTHLGALAHSQILYDPEEPTFHDENRRWQGIPSIEITPGGRLFVNFYTGGVTETGGNFVVLNHSDDAGETWTTNEVVVSHPDPEIRNYDPALWTDPSGRLWMFWAQCRDFFDGRVGVWASICAEPDADQPIWSEPRRISDGLMLNKPIVTTKGEWLLPVALWACQEPTEDHGLDALRFSNVYASTDGGQTFELRGSADVPNRSFDEHMLVERRDGTLWMLVRCFDGIGESTSYDDGRTWKPGRRDAIDGPCSRFHVRRLPSGRLLLVNHTGFGDRSTAEDLASQGNVKDWKGRSHLTALLSEDDGASWPYRLLLDERDGVSYPDAAIDGENISVVYDYDRMTSGQILMARITESDILAGDLVSADSRLRILVNQAQGVPVVGARP